MIVAKCISKWIAKKVRENTTAKEIRYDLYRIKTLHNQYHIQEEVTTILGHSEFQNEVD